MVIRTTKINAYHNIKSSTIYQNFQFTHHLFSGILSKLERWNFPGIVSGSQWSQDNRGFNAKSTGHGVEMGKMKSECNVNKYFCADKKRDKPFSTNWHFDNLLCKNITILIDPSTFSHNCRGICNYLTLCF